MKLRLFLFALLLIPTLGFSQYNQLYRHHEMGVFGGTSNYYGDLQENMFPSYGYNPVGALQYKYFTNPKVGYRFALAFTTLSAADSLSTIPANQARNLSFATNLFELSTGIEYSILPVDKNFYKISPYVFGGLSVFYHNPYAYDDLNKKVFLRPLSTEGQGLYPYTNRRPYRLVNMAVPVGGGFKVLVGKKVTVNVEMGFRFVAGDYMDDVSTTYVNLDTLQKYKGNEAVLMSYRANRKDDWDGNYPNLGYQRGNTTKYDMYWFGGVGLNVYFDSWGSLFTYKQTKCPTKSRRSW